MEETPTPDTPSRTAGSSVVEVLQGSQMLRLLGIGSLILLLQIPVLMIRDVIEERSWRRAEAVADVQAKWGGEQQIAGPRLVVPVTRTIPSAAAASWNRPARTEKRSLYILPDRLEAEAQLDTQALHRGIFDVPVYELGLQLDGEFSPPDLGEQLGPNDEIHWDRAALVIEISEVRAIQRASELTWRDEGLPFRPGPTSATTTHPAIHVALGERAKQGGSFSLLLNLKGSEAFYLAAAGKDTQLSVLSDWADPSFQGSWLPSQREVHADGFEARWSVPNLGRGFPHMGVESDEVAAALSRATFGVQLSTPIDPYRMAERSAKYATLFLLLTFGTLWLFEVLAGVRIHAVQYLLVGGAMCLFYLLEISLAEHLGFGLAYILASSGVIGLIAAYGIAMLGRSRRAGIVGGVLVALYGYLYVLLTNQDYALVAGSLGLFCTLGAVMFLTRRVAWGAVGLRFSQAAGRSAERQEAP